MAPESVSDEAGHAYNGSGGQRNAMLTQYQLDHTYATCPDPDAPPSGTFRGLGGSGGHVSVVTDPPPSG